MISVLAADGRRFEPLAGGDAAARVAVMSAEWTVDSDAPGPRAVRDRTAVYLGDLKAPDAGTGSTAALPLLTEAGALGYLGVWWAGPRQATAVEREYLRSMAETTSRALERARLREAERREHTRVEALAELTRLLAAALTPEAIGEVVADRVRAAVGGADALCFGAVSQSASQPVSQSASQPVSQSARTAGGWYGSPRLATPGRSPSSSRTCRWTSARPRPMPRGQAGRV